MKKTSTGSIDGATSPSDSWHLDLIHDVVVLDMDGFMLEMTYVGIASRRSRTERGRRARAWKRAHSETGIGALAKREYKAYRDSLRARR